MVRFTKMGHARRYEIQKRSVLRYFENEEKWAIVYEYLTGKTFSCRFLDHAITDYARVHNCQYHITDEATGERHLFNIYHSAQTILCGVHKKHMDPFRRRNKSMKGGGFFDFGSGDKMCRVNVPVLTFFRWAIRNKVLDYLEEHQQEIRDDMTKMARLKRKLATDDAETPKKRRRLRDSKVNTVFSDNAGIQMVFQKT